MKKIRAGMCTVILITISMLVLSSCMARVPQVSPAMDQPSADTPSAPPATPVQTATPVQKDFSGAVADKDRDAFKDWADAANIAEINQRIAALSDDEKASLCAFLLDSDASGQDRTVLLGLMKTILSEYPLGFYAHIFSYTNINLTGDGFYYCGGGRIELARDSFLSLSDTDKRNTLMHECFHSFNDQNQGPDGALNEGSAIWIYKKVFGTNSPAEDFAEATYGTKLYYKTYMDAPDYPLSAPVVFNDKLIEVYTWLSEGDPSRLPWWDNSLLNAMYERYYASIDRDVDFYSIWLPSAQNAREAMLQDPLMLKEDRLPMPTVQH